MSYWSKEDRSAFNYWIESLKLRDAWRARKEALHQETSDAGRVWDILAEEFGYDRAKKAGAVVQPGRPEIATLADIVSAVPADRVAKEADIVRWVFQNRTVPFPLLDVSKVPSRGALGLLEWVQQSPLAQRELYVNLWAKLLPSRMDQDEMERMRDDGRAQVELIEAFLGSMENDGRV